MWSPQAEQEPEVIDRVFRLRGGPAEAYACSDLEVMLESGAGTGKSFMWLVKAHDCARDNPGSRQLFLRKTRKSLNVVLEDWEREILYPGHPAIHGMSHYTNRSFYRWPNGAEVWLGGLDNPDKVMSSKWDRITLFEGTDATLRDWEQCLTRLRSFRTPYHQAAMDVNPTRHTHWANQRADQPYKVMRGLEGILKPPRPNQTQMTRIQALHQDNPMLWDNERGAWTAKGAEYMQTLNALTGTRRLRLLEHQWVSAEGMVWPEFDEARNVLDGRLEQNDTGGWQIVLADTMTRKAPPPIQLLSFTAAGDKGFRNPGALQLYGWDREERCYLVKEVYHAGRGIDWWASWVEKWHKKYKLRWLAFDPSAPDYIDYFNDRLGYRGQRGGVPRLVRGANNTFELGRDEVAFRLSGGQGGVPQLFFLRETLEHAPDPECLAAYDPTSALEEIEGYVYKPPPAASSMGDQAPDDPERPLKKADHAMDTLRYHCVEAFGRKNIPIEKPQGPPPGTLGHALGWAKAMKAAKRNGHR